jgi:hypothetical protein
MIFINFCHEFGSIYNNIMQVYNLFSPLSLSPEIVEAFVNQYWPRRLEQARPDGL